MKEMELTLSVNDLREAGVKNIEVKEVIVIVTLSFYGFVKMFKEKANQWEHDSNKWGVEVTYKCGFIEYKTNTNVAGYNKVADVLNIEKLEEFKEEAK